MDDGGVDDGVARARAWLLTLAVSATVLLVVVYLLGVRTTWGQRLDATALSGRAALDLRAVHAASRLLTTISIGALVLLGGAIVLFALMSARPELALGAAMVIGGSTVTTEILKRAVLTRPRLGVVDALGSRASFPSGHTTVAMSLAVAAMLVTPAARRGLVALLVCLYPAAIGVAVVATANHRPSDPIGAVLVVTAWGAFAGWLLLVEDEIEHRERAGPPLGPVFALGGVVLLVVAFVGLVSTAAVLRSDRLGTVELGGAFVAAAAAIVGAVLVAFAALLGTFRQATLASETPLPQPPRKRAANLSTTSRPGDGHPHTR